MMTVVLLHFALALALFYLLNWVGSHSRNFGYLQLSLVLRTDEAPAFNFFLKTLAPAIFVTLCATTLYQLGLDALVTHIWQLSVFYWAIRIGFNLVFGRRLLMSWAGVSIQAAVSIAATWLAYRYLILPKRPLFPSAQELGTQLWLLIALFLYATFNNVRQSAAGPEHRRLVYLRHEYNKLRTAFGPMIESLSGPPELQAIAYAVMIHEDFNRPLVARRLERLLGPKLVHTFGIMQVKSSRALDDRESAQLGLERLAEASASLGEELRKKEPWRWWREVIAPFNRDDEYISEVREIAERLLRQVLPEKDPASSEAKGISA
jgi:hypothetical protein